MKNKDSRLFDFLNWTLKNQTEKPKDYQPSYFLLNRWLSMANSQSCLILNSTTNRWLKHLKNFDFGSFYYYMLPKHVKRIDYFKKKNKQIEDKIEDIQNVADRLECSIREIEIFENTLEELSKSNN